MSRKILIVDDEPNIVFMLSHRLKQSGYEVVTGRDGQEALEMARKENPDIIILDLMLPKMNGYTVCGLLKRDAAFSKIPVIMLTARAQESDKKQGREAGADAYVKKPFKSEELLDIIERFLSQPQ
ncbi:MAG: response regulator [Candidatus Aureabacteria bacterium]|nr:response regulator [Candidatus Auribacterota bacterium]